MHSMLMFNPPKTFFPFFHITEHLEISDTTIKNQVFYRHIAIETFIKLIKA